MDKDSGGKDQDVTKLLPSGRAMSVPKHILFEHGWSGTAWWIPHPQGSSHSLVIHKPQLRVFIMHKMVSDSSALHFIWLHFFDGCSWHYLITAYFMSKCDSWWLSRVAYTQHPGRSLQLLFHSLEKCGPGCTSELLLCLCCARAWHSLGQDCANKSILWMYSCCLHDFSISVI